MIRGKFTRRELKGQCWHCVKRANGIVNWRDGSETPECFSCAIHFGKCKIRGMKKQAKISHNSLVENKKVEVLQTTL